MTGVTILTFNSASIGAVVMGCMTIQMQWVSEYWKLSKNHSIELASKIVFVIRNTNKRGRIELKNWFVLSGGDS